ncbi:unnamed protein product [Cylicostephanus goldi]|uniref:Uncharacterized protein n=1 Tax=Cylicostephanus goldi TaxID=71465 RepID=A0A3P7PYB6_CYLGO|nr:unnamed protein product [Cylicostephanus goldi]
MAGVLRAPFGLDKNDSSWTSNVCSQRSWRLHHLCTYNARTFSTNADLHALLAAAEHIKYHAIAVQGTKSRKKDGQQMTDGTLIIRGKTSRNVGTLACRPSIHRPPCRFACYDYDFHVG